jgi:diacylglycerol kinase (ATP)
MGEQNSAERPRAAIVYNPVKVAVDALRAAVVSQEEQSGWASSSWFETDAEDSGRAAARKALESSPAVVVVAGGDGTVRVVAEEVHATGVPLALVPSGTANLLVRNLHLPITSLELSIRAAFEGKNRRIDIAFAELERSDHTRSKEAYLVMAGIGLDANMAANTNSVLKKRIGWLAYIEPIARSVLANKQLDMRYRIDGSKTRSIRAHTVIVGNVGTLTANILLLPDAVVDDGLLDVVVLRPKGAGGWTRIGYRLALNGILHRSKGGRVMLRSAPAFHALQYSQARALEVRFATPEIVQLDGDSLGEVVAAKITVRQRGLVIRVPKTTA